MDQKTGQNPFITLIMPVYNAEKYLRSAIESVLAQTFQDFELLLVDDGSPDGSGAICDAYAREFAGKVRVLHLAENGGASNARNVAIEHAAGTYIGFMDSDDTIDSSLFEKVAAPLKKYQVDSVIYGISEEYYDAKGSLKYTERVLPEEEKLLPDRAALRGEIIRLEERTLYGYTCNKIYRLDKVKRENIRYQAIKLHEDTLFNIAYFMEAESAYLIAAAPYHYAKRIENSVTSQFVPEYYALHTKKIQMIYDQYEYWDRCAAPVKRILGNIYARYTLSALQRNCDPRAGMNHKMRKAWLREQYASPLYAALIGYCEPENKLLKIFARLFRKKRICFTLFCARSVYIVKNKMPILFAKLKQKN